MATVSHSSVGEPPSFASVPNPGQCAQPALREEGFQKHGGGKKENTERSNAQWPSEDADGLKLARQEDQQEEGGRLGAVRCFLKLCKGEVGGKLELCPSNKRTQREGPQGLCGQQ
jgi:hypothetical protein